VSYRLSTAASVTAVVQDVLGRQVATVFSGRRTAGKQELRWNPAALPDGWYTLVLTASAGGKQVQTSTRFWVDRTLAAVASTATAFSPNGDGRLDTVGISFRLTIPAHAQVLVLKGPEVVATLLDQDLPAGPLRLTWDGSRLPDGTYTVTVNATDSLTMVTQSLAVRIDRKPPALGLVSLSPLAFRLGEPGRLLLVVNGRRRNVTVRRAGLVRVYNPSAVRTLSAYAVDLAGNKSRVISVRR
jgi:flagellar hook assembly protein FlgD